MDDQEQGAGIPAQSSAVGSADPPKSGIPMPLVAGAAGLALVALAVWWFGIRSPSEPVTEALPPSTPTLVPSDTSGDTQGADMVAGELPALGASDALVRQLVSRLSQHPRIAEWLVTDDLVLRFVDAVVAMAGGRSPSEELEFMIPGQPMTTLSAAGDQIISPESFRRYDLMTEAVLSLDTAGAAQLYARLRPLFVEAYAALGIPGGSWDEALTLAVQNVLAAQVPTATLEVWGEAGYYEFVDPELESLSQVDKHLLRLGPENAERVQSKVRDLARAIGI